LKALKHYLGTIEELSWLQSNKKIEEAKSKSVAERHVMCATYQQHLIGWFGDHAEKGAAYFNECQLLQAAVEVQGTSIVYDEGLLSFCAFPFEDTMSTLGLAAGSHSLIYFLARRRKGMAIKSFNSNKQGEAVLPVLLLDAAGFGPEHIRGVSNHAQNMAEVDVISKVSVVQRVRRFLGDLGNIKSEWSVESFAEPGWIAEMTHEVTTNFKLQYVRETSPLQTREEREREEREEKEKAAQFAKMTEAERAAAKKEQKRRDSAESETFAAGVRAGVLLAGE
jgi:hypothetical protein